MPRARGRMRLPQNTIAAMLAREDQVAPYSWDDAQQAAPRMGEIALSLLPGSGDYMDVQESRRLSTKALEEMSSGNYGTGIADYLASMGAAATALIPFVGAGTVRKIGGRLWPDLPLSARRPNLAEKFLKEHGFEPYRGDGPRVNTYDFDGDALIAYSPAVKDGKQIILRKTFRNPTLKQLRNWMGY